MAAEQIGVARACLDSAVDYAKTRSQFGAPIGSFQAIKHRCAEVLLDVEFADAVLADAVDAERALPDAELAFIVASRAAVAAAEACIHIHGGIGFTWEHSAHSVSAARTCQCRPAWDLPRLTATPSPPRPAYLPRRGLGMTDELTVLRLVAIKGRVSS